MKPSLAFIIPFALSASAYPGLRSRQDSSANTFQRPGTNDARGPCPALNTLANHGYLPRNGRGITLDMMITQMLNVFNVDPEITTGLANAILTPMNTTDSTSLPFDMDSSAITITGAFDVNDSCNGLPCISLDETSLHGSLEHDVSLVRNDARQGDNHSIKQDLVGQLIGSSNENEHLTIDNIISFRQERLQTQQSLNPNLVFGLKESTLASGESALLISVLGDRFFGGRVHIDYVRVFMGEERLPQEEGWNKRSSTIKLEEIKKYMAKISRN